MSPQLEHQIGNTENMNIQMENDHALEEYAEGSKTLDAREDDDDADNGQQFYD